MTLLYIVVLMYAVGVASKRLYDRRIDVMTGLFIGTIYFVLIPLALLLWQGELDLPKLTRIEGIGNIILRTYVHEVDVMLAIVLCSLMLCHLYSISVAQEHGWSSMIENTNYVGLFLVSLLLFVSLSTALFLKAGLAQGGNWYTSRGNIVEEYGSLGVLLGQLLAASKLLILCIAVGWYRRAEIGSFACFGIVVAFCVFDLYMSSNRIYTLQAMILLSCVLMMNHEFVKLGLLALAAIPFGTVMNLFAMARSRIHMGGISLDGLISGYRFAAAHRIGGGFTGFVMGITEGADFMVLLQIVKTFPKAHPFLGGATIAKLFFSVVPRSIWADKPMNITGAMAELFVGGKQGTSLAATIYGEFYANFGIFALLAIPAAMIAIHRLLQWCFRNSDLLVPMSIVYGFTLTRMAFSDTVLPLILTGLWLRGWSAFFGKAGHAVAPGMDWMHETRGAKPI
jgi:hypothetical protein